MSRKWVAGVLVVVLVLAVGLAGCAGGDTGDKVRVGVTVYNMSSFITQGREGMEAFAEANDIELLWNSANNDVATQASQVESLINQGRAAMWLDSGSGVIFAGGGGEFAIMIVDQEGESTSNTGVAPLPTGFNSANGSGFQGVTGYFISAQSAKRQACWTWISYLTQQSTVVSGLPARRSVMIPSFDIVAKLHRNPIMPGSMWIPEPSHSSGPRPV